MLLMELFFFNVFIYFVISHWNECNFNLSRKVGAGCTILGGLLGKDRVKQDEDWIGMNG